jgi:3-phenylpropionate/trans-cinnamate dioxygenase ferredoxin reductase subunit
MPEVHASLLTVASPDERKGQLMKTVKYLLIGGGMASGHAAKQIRRQDSEGAILLVGEESHVPYDRPPLSKEFLRGEKPADKLYFDSREFFQEQNIELALGAPIEKLDMSDKTAFLKGSDEPIAFDKALIATGGRPVRLNLPGADLPGVYYLRTLNDSTAINAVAREGQRVVIIGAGFIGLEAAASLTQMGLKVDVVETAPHIWPRFADAKLAALFQGYCAERGVNFHTGEMATEIRGESRASLVVTRPEKELPCDFICVGVGLLPNEELAKEAGLKVGNGVIVNEYLQSSHPDIYAAGDVANYFDPIFEKQRRVEHWGHAEYCGQVAGLNMSGANTKYNLVTYVWSDIFDLHLEFAGDETDHDQMLVRGTMEKHPFTVLYLRENRLTAYFAVNIDSREFIPLKRLIQRKIDLSGKEAQLQDPGFSLRELL